MQAYISLWWMSKIIEINAKKYILLSLAAAAAGIADVSGLTARCCSPDPSPYSLRLELIPTGSE
jgi:hypothetical protein